jgi:hypothetical protein
MPKRLAITISGAVSLGSYEAGVLYEVLEAIAVHNTDQATTDSEKIYVDVITGASAGGMCATVLAHALLYHGAGLRDPKSNALHDPWIVDVDLKTLLAQQKDEDPAKSLLSSNLIESISKKYITSRYSTNPPPPAAPHPAIDPSKPLRLGLALSNLDGVDYALPLQTGGQFTYTRYQDEFRRVYTLGAESDNLSTWDEVRNAAVACGAFPFAFRVKALQRTLGDYVNPVPADFPKLGMNFAYTDGGVFQNEPLGMAKDFVDQIDHHLDAESRFYLFIAPGARDSSIDQGHLLTKDNANFFATGMALVSAIYNQARFHDWILAEKYNHDIRVFNRRAQQLQQALLNGTLDPAVIGPAGSAYLAQLRAENPALSPAYVDQAVTRLSLQFDPEYKSLVAAKGAAVARVWLESILVLELAADLDCVEEMQIYGVTAKDSELAGSSIMAFAGFFDQSIRQHDYDVGRNKAKLFIQGQNTSPTAPNQPALGPLRYTPGAPISLNPAYDHFDVSKLSADSREDLKDRLIERAGTVLEEAEVPWLIRKSLIAFYVSGKIEEFLKLDEDVDGSTT